MPFGHDIEGGQQHGVSTPEGERLLVGQCSDAEQQGMALPHTPSGSSSSSSSSGIWRSRWPTCVQWVSHTALQPVMAGVSRLATCVKASCAGAAVRTRLTLLVCLLLVSAALTQSLDDQHLQAMIEQMHDARLASLIVFVLLFAVAVVLLLPGMLLSIGAGAAYGFPIGSIVAWLGTVLGQAGAFMLGRYLLRDVVYSYMVQRIAGFSTIDQNIGRDGWKLVLLLRLSPVLPYNILNYVLGVTSIDLVPYLASSAVAAVPYVCLFAYLGSQSADLYQLLHDGASAHLSPELLILLSCIMILSVVGLFFVCKQAILAAPQTADGDSATAAARADIVRLGQSTSIGSNSSHSRGTSNSRVLVLRA